MMKKLVKIHEVWHHYEVAPDFKYYDEFFSRFSKNKFNLWFNLGLITYRETALLHNPKTDSASRRVYVATVVAHELAHQWFGDLVTMKWWDE